MGKFSARNRARYVASTIQCRGCYDRVAEVDRNALCVRCQAKRREDAPTQPKAPGADVVGSAMRVGLLAVLLLAALAPGAAADVDVPAPLECRVDLALHTLRWVSGHEVPGDRCHPPFASPWPFCPYDGCPFRPVTVTTRLPEG